MYLIITAYSVDNICTSESSLVKTTDSSRKIQPNDPVN